MRDYFISELNKYPEIEKIIDLACDAEFVRESSIGAGISLENEWTQEGADTYKQKQYEELLKAIAEAKKLHG